MVVGILDPDGINLNPLNNNSYSDEYKKLSESWRILPAYKSRDIILKYIDNYQIMLFQLGTGTGKTVIIPKLALHYLNYKKGVYVSLPKKLITLEAARFAAATLDVTIGKQVGYKFRGVDKSSSSTKLLYTSDGVLTNYLIKCINDKNAIKHYIFIIDEIHERKLQVDLNLLLLQILITKYIDLNLKVILMSAGANEEEYASYFNKFKYITYELNEPSNYKVDVINGIDLYPYMSTESEKFNLILKILNDLLSGSLPIYGDIQYEKYINTNVLIFCATKEETRRIGREISKIGIDREVYVIYSDSIDLIRLSELNVPDKSTGKNKLGIIVATNVAESSLTLSNIGVVIDTGTEIKKIFYPATSSFIKESSFRMERSLISWAQILQRKGRTGRTTDGIYIKAYNDSDVKSKYPTPDIQTEDISQLILNLYNLYINSSVNKMITAEVNDILRNMISPIVEEKIEYYNRKLVDMNLILPSLTGGITDLGELCIKIPLSLSDGLSIIKSFYYGIAKDVIRLLFVLNLSDYKIANLFIPVINDQDNTEFYNQLTSTIKNATYSKTQHIECHNLIENHSNLLNHYILKQSDINTKQVFSMLLNNSTIIYNIFNETVKRKDPKNKCMYMLRALHYGLKYNTPSRNNFICSQVMENSSGYKYMIHSDINNNICNNK